MRCRISALALKASLHWTPSLQPYVIVQTSQHLPLFHHSCAPLSHNSRFAIEASVPLPQTSPHPCVPWSYSSLFVAVALGLVTQTPPCLSMCP